jgi:D-alanyl-D-alanine carboxypeptidase
MQLDDQSNSAPPESIRKWLLPAVDYARSWTSYQLRQLELPGCSVAIRQNGELLLDEAYGVSNLDSRAKLTTKHRFRVASHSKAVTSAGTLLLRDRGVLRLDDSVGTYVSDLHKEVARLTLWQLLSHSAGILRDGLDAGFWTSRRPFLTRADLIVELHRTPVLQPDLRFKYSNCGYGLLALVIEAATGRPYEQWITDNIIIPVKMNSTTTDYTELESCPLVFGHSRKLPAANSRSVIDGRISTGALAGATGLVSTASDLTLFFSKLLANAEESFISTDSRRQICRQYWRDKGSSGEVYYGLGLIIGHIGDWTWFGHSGGFPGQITQTITLVEPQIAISVLCNSQDGPAQAIAEGIAHIASTFSNSPIGSEWSGRWAGRWYSLWGPST